MIWIIISISLLYFIFLAILWYGWDKLPENIEHKKPELFLSVIVSVRNESAAIGYLLEDLNKQNYPPDKYEVLIMDDHSTDNTCQVIQRMKRDMRYPLILFRLKDRLHENVSSKKAAIRLGVDHARGDYIVMTDGDTRVEPEWLRNYNNTYGEKHLRMVTGPVSLNGTDSFFNMVQAIEFASLVGTGAAALQLGMPVMCNGANISFKKETFKEAGGYHGNENIPSGDDLFLMERIHSIYPGAIGFLKNYQSIVYAKPAATAKEFFHQRIRWAGKWNNYQSSIIVLLAVFIFMVHSSFLLAIILSITGQFSLWVLSFLMIMKALLEYFFLKRIYSFYRKKIPLIPFIFCTLFYSFYAVSFGILANLSTYSWKERKYR